MTTEKICKNCKHDDDLDAHICYKCDRAGLTGWAYPIKKAIYVRSEHDFFEEK